ncbi:unnamed protein product [Rotaria socialis]|uniref:Transmembrane protein n=1 Tax=Rotaria socialis TaxID=392032 RepID=A0A818GF08_9BILA|nr:unnamed protein product [Rotaria socialis]CAF3392533.1 unnamed protein product [Rotaria socialis]CAF3490920.1 unnamed protein product [Rotaria socialis]CAF3498974.1 unnamed protein product [Rotaria socialis]
MSSYSDANYHRSMIFQNQIRMNYIQTLNPKPQNFLLNLNRRRIICLILILLIIYLKLLIEAWKMLNEISSKDEYLHQQWLFEQEKIVNQKKNLQEFLNNLKSSSNESTKPCKKCFDSISKFYSKAIVNIYEKNQNIKEEYNRIVLPLQYLSSLLCLINNFLIQIIFKKCWKFSFLSNILLILCLCIYAELFLPNEPNISYTLFIAWSIVIFTIYLLTKVFSTLLIIEHYQLMNLQNNNQ